MESKVVQETERAMIEAQRSWSPEERLKAFVMHCQVMMEFYQAGKDFRATHKDKEA